MVHTVTPVWVTPNAEQMIIDMARVSSPKPKGAEGVGLIKYLIEHRHWSPFEMANLCVEVFTSRDIGRQLLRHRSFSFQEFSQRYAEVYPTTVFAKEARLQDTANRQKSLETYDTELKEDWAGVQEDVVDYISDCYRLARERGIAKEVVRSLLPEGLTPTRMYMNGNFRSWLHFIQAREGWDTQKETRQVATQVKTILEDVAPNIMDAAFGSKMVREAKLDN